MDGLIRISKCSDEAFSVFDGSQVVVTPELVLFWKPPNPFGQWTESPFEIDGVTYNCAEQYMMAEKARLFNDKDIESKILETSSPRQQKKLGKQVSGFNTSKWVSERCNIVFRGNVAKFRQNPELGQILLETGDRRLAEASPLDKIWGISFAAEHPHAYDEMTWKGLNFLGNVFEDVRTHLRAGQQFEEA